jgi:hypothetical protein
MLSSTAEPEPPAHQLKLEAEPGSGSALELQPTASTASPESATRPREMGRKRGLLGCCCCPCCRAVKRKRAGEAAAACRVACTGMPAASTVALSAEALMPKELAAERVQTPRHRAQAEPGLLQPAAAQRGSRVLTERLRGEPEQEPAAGGTEKREAAEAAGPGPGPGTAPQLLPGLSTALSCRQPKAGLTCTLMLPEAEARSVGRASRKPAACPSCPLPCAEPPSTRRVQGLAELLRDRLYSSSLPPPPAEPEEEEEEEALLLRVTAAR